MNFVTDMLGRKISMPKEPLRIISLVPSQTELLYDLGLNDEVVGITKFCVHPDNWFRTKTRVGGTKNVNIKLAQDLKPNLIIANKEENTKEDIDELSTFCPVWVSEIHNLNEAIQMIRNISEIVKKTMIGECIIESVTQGFAKTHQIKQNSNAAYLIWEDPIMVAANNTFIDSILTHLGIANVFSGQDRYPIITEKDLLEAQPDYILLSSEPYPFKEKHLLKYQNLLPQTEVLLVDGELFSWYGSRLQISSNYFLSLFN